MDYTLSPLPLDITPVPSAARRRHRRSKWKNGRFYVFLIFIWLRMVDVFTLTCVYPQLPMSQKPPVIAWVLVTAIWTTVLLLAIWLRQSWAKHILAGSLLSAVIFMLTGIPGLPDVPHPKRDFMLIMQFTVAYFPVALILMASRKIHKLTMQSLKVAGDKPSGWPGGH
jgi:predicted cobalt transporter CbtA